ncbi:hypothetical protein OQA88_8856 [Cercophora sp. LCS_1]
MVLPFLEVSHLPSSSSFFSAIVQPLGLRYLSTERGHFPSITYGDGLGAVFQLRQVAASRDRPLKISHLALSAPSPEAADDAYDCAVRASPDDTRDLHHARSSFDYSSASGASATRTLGGGGKVRINITDFDGNTMAVVYRPPPQYGDHYGGSTVRATQSTPKEASRILDWNYDVVSSELPPPSSRTDVSSRSAARRPYEASSRVADEPYSSLRRSMTEGATPYEPTSPRQTSSGFNTGTVVGALLGVAAGAALGGALTYSKYKTDRSRAPRQDYDAAPPTFTRRSTFPDPYPDRKERYVDPNREMSKMRYPEEYAPISEHRGPPEYIARYSQARSHSRDLDDHYSKAPSRSRDLDDYYSKASSRSRDAEDHYSKAGSRSRDFDDRYSKAPSRSRDYDDYEDVRGRHSVPRSRASARARSATASHRETLLIDDREHRSQAGSRSSRHPPIVQRSYTAYEPQERDSYVSARSHRSSSTLRGGPPQAGESTQMVSRSRSGSRMTTTTVKVGGNGGSRAPTYVSARGVPLPASRANTYISAREVPLPSSHGGWDEDDTGSVVPEDSISCVGIEGRKGRRYH